MGNKCICIVFYNISLTRQRAGKFQRGIARNKKLYLLGEYGIISERYYTSAGSLSDEGGYFLGELRACPAGKHVGRTAPVASWVVGQFGFNNGAKT